ncbi:hypothetical protein QN397_17470 [Variovorax sp. RTB1]|uniref:hypothetical protein n=1 Tax=Variovorax sp. RTB1 TaxID=3048631 RepID=UPI002B2361AA|nr:hypothetical protein [Variovorax sp. RTB1]MEB0113136.1 hypothetical protein [Variovorax sp. RTB1]
MELTKQEREELEAVVRKRHGSAALARSARCVLLRIDGERRVDIPSGWPATMLRLPAVARLAVWCVSRVFQIVVEVTGIRMQILQHMRDSALA